jgi:hypothetical protein
MRKPTAIAERCVLRFARNGVALSWRQVHDIIVVVAAIAGSNEIR